MNSPDVSTVVFYALFFYGSKMISDCPNDFGQVPISAAASGWTGWALAHLEFGSSVNPITTRGADYALHITASPPGFENPAASLPMLWMGPICFGQVQITLYRSKL